MRTNAYRGGVVWGLVAMGAGGAILLHEPGVAVAAAAGATTLIGAVVALAASERDHRKRSAPKVPKRVGTRANRRRAARAMGKALTYRDDPPIEVCMDGQRYVVFAGARRAVRTSRTPGAPAGAPVDITEPATLDRLIARAARERRA